MIHNILITSALASLSVAGSAAAQAPTVGPVKILEAGQTVPVAIAANHLPVARRSARAPSCGAGWSRCADPATRA